MCTIVLYFPDNYEFKYILIIILRNVTNKGKKYVSKSLIAHICGYLVIVPNSILVAESYSGSKLSLKEEKAPLGGNLTINSATWEPLEQLYKGEVTMTRKYNFLTCFYSFKLYY